MVMTIPEQHYVGFRRQDAGQQPLGFATPYGTDAAAKKRMSTVDSWASHVWHNGNRVKQPDAQVHDNVLLEGFRLCEEVRRHSGWGNGNVVWRIEDPRGFELEITSPNLASILDCSTIVNGTIQGRCVWGREGATNVLLPEASEPYREAAHLTKLSKQKVAAKDVAPGDKIRLRDGTDILYLGAYHFLMVAHKQDYHRYGRGTGSGYRHKLAIGQQKKRHMYIPWEDVAKMTDTAVDKLLNRTVDDFYKKHYSRTVYKGGPKSAGDLKIAEVLERQAVIVDQASVCTYVNAKPFLWRHNFADSKNVIHISIGGYGKKLGYELKEVTDYPGGTTKPGLYFTRNAVGEVFALRLDQQSGGSKRDMTIPVTAALGELGTQVSEVNDTYVDFASLGWPLLDLVLKTSVGDVLVELENLV